MRGVVAQLLLGHHAIGDVGLRAGNPHGLPIRATHRDRPAQHPRQTPVAVLDTVFALKDRRFSFEVGGQFRFEPGDVLIGHRG